MQAATANLSSRAGLRLKATFWLDAALLLFFCALETVPFTGLVLHEWIGLALIGMIVAHLLLSWTWISSQTRQILRCSTRMRVNYLLNLVLFALATAVMLSGIMISQEAVPLLTGMPPTPLSRDLPWDLIHDRFSNLILLFTGLHLAINWEWAVAAGRKILRRQGAGVP